MSEENEGGRALTDEDIARAMQELKSVRATDVVNEVMMSLVSFASTKLGLSDATAELRDLDDAHLTIEAFGALVKVVDREVGESQTGGLHATLAQLQLGYVQALDLAGLRPPEPPSAASRGPAPAEPAPEAKAEPASDRPVAADAGPGGEAEKPAAKGPSAGKAAARKPAGKAAARKPAAKEPSAKRPAAKKSPAKKPATKKPPAKKPAANEPPSGDAG